MARRWSAQEHAVLAAGVDQILGSKMPWLPGDCVLVAAEVQWLREEVAATSSSPGQDRP